VVYATHIKTQAHAGCCSREPQFASGVQLGSPRRFPTGHPCTLIFASLASTASSGKRAGRGEGPFFASISGLLAALGAGPSRGRRDSSHALPGRRRATPSVRSPARPLAKPRRGDNRSTRITQACATYILDLARRSLGLSDDRESFLSILTSNIPNTKWQSLTLHRCYPSGVRRRTVRLGLRRMHEPVRANDGDPRARHRCEFSTGADLGGYSSTDAGSVVVRTTAFS